MFEKFKNGTRQSLTGPIAILALQALRVSALIMFLEEELAICFSILLYGVPPYLGTETEAAKAAKA